MAARLVIDKLNRDNEKCAAEIKDLKWDVKHWHGQFIEKT